MIHADLMLVVVEILIVLDLEPLGPLPGVVTLAGFAKHTAHGICPLPILTCMWSLRPLSAQWVTMCHNVSVSRSESRLNSGRSVQSRPGLRC